jgi:hypothetical protein
MYRCVQRDAGISADLRKRLELFERGDIDIQHDVVT